ncbi:carboxyl-terminal processing protease [Cupriavidus sp. OV038]|uniref:S41 family peptidase n=1 Tax=unclassified Cupriavidus TaxID=2640874 RepID=UPI0008ECE650|nr:MULTISPECIES: S41 family peptidase [unclassified Cupriavidus]SFC79617.1 carboxyl-terminal processing protease [Cupriavidus sp. OV038]SFO77307.1 carboxyl-terminal processing protease [Cupriavidus sp. OV096]
MRKTLKNISLVSVGVVAGVLATLQISATAQNSSGPLPLDQLRLMSDIFGQIKREYVEPVDDKKLLTEAIKGMVASLDPHSAYLDEKDFKELQEGTRGRFAGLGIEISQEEGLVKVINPIEDTPAFRAGIQPGDLITRIDDKPVRGLPLEQAVKRMRGEPGTKVTLTIYRKSEERTFPVSITRAEIRVQSVKTKMLDNNTIGWIRLTSFQERTVSDLGRRLREMAEKNPGLKGVILDLRNNGGGVLQGAVGVAAAFLPDDATVVSTNGQVPDAKRVYKATFNNYRLSSLEDDPLKDLPPLFKKIPMIVLTNAYSASASEIVAGALQDHHRATLMGKTTFGKGSVQTVRPLTNDTGIKLTIAYYYTPTGKSIQAKGIRPDIPVDQNPEGDPDDALITREIDTERHLHNKQESEEPEMNAREQRRVDELRRLEEENAKKTPEEREKDRRKKPVEFGTADDFMLQQAIAQLNGKPVQRSKSRLEASQAAGKPDTDADKGKAKPAADKAPAKPASKPAAKPASQPPASAPMGDPLGTPTGKNR